jgi:hypothetical protein
MNDRGAAKTTVKKWETRLKKAAKQNKESKQAKVE